MIWLTDEPVQTLSHDLPCRRCGHAIHSYLACSEDCDCIPPPVPGAPAPATLVTAN